MLRIYADKYVALGQDFHELEALGYLGKPGNVTSESEKYLTEEEIESLASMFVRVRNHCSDIGLKVCAKIAEEAGNAFSIDPLPWEIVGPRVAELRRCFVAEMESTMCYAILSGREAFYTDDPSVFLAQATLDKFPSVKFDIVEAGKCFATERFTACVGHLMKVAEYGYVSFVRHAQLDSGMERNWNKGLNQIHEKLAKKQTPFGSITEEDEQYFVGLEGYLRTVKTAWRNPASHIPKIFIESQARSMFEVVRTLMDFAAQRLSFSMEGVVLTDESSY